MALDSHFLFSSALLVVVSHLVLAQINTPPFPELPTQFITEVEANILNRNRTVQVTEYYDFPGDRGRIEVFSNGTRHINIYSFAQQLIFRVRDVDERRCTVQPFNRSTRFNPFTTFLPNGTARIQSVADFFRFGRRYHDYYNGTGMARGILCDIYVSTVNNDTFNYSMKWYFAVQPDWNMPLGGDSPTTAVPVRLELEGYNQNFDRTLRQPTNGSHYFHHIYEFVNFRVGTPDESLRLFDPPTGIPCTGQPPVKTLPQFPSQFQMDVQSSWAANQTSYWSLIAYDSKRQIISYLYNFPTELANRTGLQGVAGQHHLIHNYNEGTQYNMTLTACTITKLNAAESPNENIVDHGKVILASANKVFGFQVVRNFTYQGEREVDGITTDMWMTVRNDVPLVPSAGANQSTLWQYYFSKPKWHYYSFGAAEENQVLVRVEGHSLLPGMYDKFKYVSLISNVQFGPPFPFMFDNTRCYNASTSTTKQFVLPTPYDDFRKNITARGSISMALSNIMKVDQSRFHVTTFSSPDNQVTVSVRIHEIPPAGDPAKLRGLTSLATATSRLNQAINSGALKIDFGSKGMVTATTTSSSTGFSNGVVAGVAIGTLILGVLLGVACYYIVQNHLRSDAVGVSYKRDVD